MKNKEKQRTPRKSFNKQRKTKLLQPRPTSRSDRIYAALWLELRQEN